eukprot:6213320-Pleurochrysis_carterae.AAC.2
MPIWAQPKSLTCGSCQVCYTDSDHNLDAPIMCKLLSNVHDHIGQIKCTAPTQLNRPRAVLEFVRCTQKCHLGCVATLYATSTDAVQSLAALQPPMLGRVNKHKVCSAQNPGGSRQGLGADGLR